jgi:hypothetical protein
LVPALFELDAAFLQSQPVPQHVVSQEAKRLRPDCEAIEVVQNSPAGAPLVELSPAGSALMEWLSSAVATSSCASTVESEQDHLAEQSASLDSGALPQSDFDSSVVSLLPQSDLNSSLSEALSAPAMTEGSSSSLSSQMLACQKLMSDLRKRKFLG